MQNLLSEALCLAQEGFYVFPVNLSTKRPVWKKGELPWGDGHRAASTDADKIEHMFERGDAIAVWLKPSGLLAIDCDLRNDAWLAAHPKEAEAQVKANTRIEDWIHENADDLESAREHSTQNGGLHFIYRWTKKTAPPAAVLGTKIQIKWDGYILWPSDNYPDAYGVIYDEGDLCEVPENLLTVIETLSGGTSTGAMPTTEEAEAIMDSDGATGERHNALLRLTQDFIRHYGGAAPVHLLPQAFLEKFRERWPDVGADRPSMFDWRVSDTGELEGELGRMFAGARVDGAGVDALTRAYAGEEPPQSVQAGAAVARAENELFTRINADEMYEEQLADVVYLIDDMLPARGLVGLAGPSGAGKTRFMAALLTCLAAGDTRPLGLPKAPRALRSLYVTNEETGEDVKRRALAFARLAQFRKGGDFFVRGKETGGFRFARNGDPIKGVVEGLCALIRKYDLDLVVFDPFVTLGADNENDSAAVDVVLSAMRDVITETGVAIIFVHHTPKDRSAAEDEWRGEATAFRGAGAIYSTLDSAWTLFPYLPDVCHARNVGRDRRKQLRLLQREKKVPKFIVLDSAKEREAEPFAPTIYELASQPVREGGKGIGALSRVPQMQPDAAITAALGLGSLIDAALSETLASVLADHYGKSVVTTLQEIVDVVDKAGVTGWEVQLDKARSTRGNGAKLLSLLKAPIHLANGTQVSVFKAAEGYQVLVV